MITLAPRRKSTGIPLNREIRFTVKLSGRHLKRRFMICGNLLLGNSLAIPFRFNLDIKGFMIFINDIDLSRIRYTGKN